MAATVSAIAVSLAGLAYLTGSDPKRRRAFRLPPAAAAHPRIGWAAVLLPGLVLPFVAGGGGFTVWIGAVSVIGWAIAALPPERTALVVRRCAALADRIAAIRLHLPDHAQPDDRVAALEARIQALEAQLADLRPRVETAEAVPAKAPARPERASELRPPFRLAEPQSSVAAPRSR